MPYSYRYGYGVDASGKYGYGFTWGFDAPKRTNQTSNPNIDPAYREALKKQLEAQEQHRLEYLRQIKSALSNVIDEVDLAVAGNADHPCVAYENVVGPCVFVIEAKGTVSTRIGKSQFTASATGGGNFERTLFVRLGIGYKKGMKERSRRKRDDRFPVLGLVAQVEFRDGEGGGCWPLNRTGQNLYVPPSRPEPFSLILMINDNEPSKNTGEFYVHVARCRV